MQYWVYIVSDHTKTVLYTGVTNGLVRRIYQHKNKANPGFTSKYNVNKLVYYESFPTPLEAITAEKRIKGWKRSKKIELIRKNNPNFDDLSGAFGE